MRNGWGCAGRHLQNPPVCHAVDSKIDSGKVEYVRREHPHAPAFLSHQRNPASKQDLGRLSRCREQANGRPVVQNKIRYHLLAMRDQIC